MTGFNWQGRNTTPPLEKDSSPSLGPAQGLPTGSALIGRKQQGTVHPAVLPLILQQSGGRGGTSCRER